MQYLLTQEELDRVKSDRFALEKEIGTAWREKYRAARSKFSDILAEELRGSYILNNSSFLELKRVIQRADKAFDDLC